jgi:hypothetical protein
MTSFKRTTYHTFALILLTATLTTIGMDKSGMNTSKPTITGDLYINQKEKTSYAGKAFIESSTAAGITSGCLNSQKMPFTPICMIVDKTPNNDGYCWTNYIPLAISNYEIDKIETTDKKDLFATLKKKFPHSLPADILYNCAQGSVLRFIVHGYPVTATCRNHPYFPETSFAEEFKKQINDFKQKPSFFSDLTCYTSDINRLIAAKILTKKGLHISHGRNGFTSIEQLMLEDKNIRSPFKYVMQRSTGTNPAFVTANIANEDDEHSSSEETTDADQDIVCLIL